PTLAPIYSDRAEPASHATDAPKLDAVGAYVLASPDRTVTITGHADEQGTDAYNFELGERRAAVAREYLVRLGVNAERIRIVSYGRSRPIETAHDAHARTRNRRDEFEVDGPSADLR